MKAPSTGCAQDMLEFGWGGIFTSLVSCFKMECFDEQARDALMMLGGSRNFGRSIEDLHSGRWVASHNMGRATYRSLFSESIWLTYLDGCNCRKLDKHGTPCPSTSKRHHCAWGSEVARVGDAGERSLNDVVRPKTRDERGRGGHHRGGAPNTTSYGEKRATRDPEGG
eukprot:scaffold119047_cov37-Tisochrysis_lutea.AAC.6